MQFLDRVRGGHAARSAAIIWSVAAAGAIGGTGCEPMALTALSVGASAGLSHTLSGISYRTFTMPVGRVRRATLAALDRMGIQVEGSEKGEAGEIIKAQSADRAIEIELESLSTKTTRMRVVAKRGPLFYDAATATEIILQTEKGLGRA